MVEAGNAQLTQLLQGEQDWSRSAIFTDTKEIIASKNCTLLPDEIE
jgi:hypothetical protein